MKEYLAVIFTPYGGGSWARSSGAETVEQVAARARRIFAQDWKTLFKVTKDVKIPAHVIEVTGHDRVEFDEGGFYIGENREILDRPIVTVMV